MNKLEKLLLDKLNKKAESEEYCWRVIKTKECAEDKLKLISQQGWEKIKVKVKEQQQEIERLNNIINECLQSVCYIEHNLDKYEEIGLDHFDYAQKKTEELKEYLIEELKGE